ncbi:MAG: HAD-IIA family hydrolase, partial [Brooklawnia sp.]
MEVLNLPEKFYSAYIFDMDGTIYLGEELLPGAARMIAELRRRDIPVRFLSNNPTKDPEMYAEKLDRLGIPTPIDDIANTIVTTTRWLKANAPDAVLFVVGEEPLKRALTEAGFELSEDPERIDIVVASYDRTFDYRKLQIAFDAIWFHKRAILV